MEWGRCYWCVDPWPKEPVDIWWGQRIRFPSPFPLPQCRISASPSNLGATPRKRWNWLEWDDPELTRLSCYHRVQSEHKKRILHFLYPEFVGLMSKLSHMLRKMPFKAVALELLTKGDWMSIWAYPLIPLEGKGKYICCSFRVWTHGLNTQLL